MPLLLTIFFVLAVLLVAQSVISLRDGYRFLNLLRRSLRAHPADFHPPVTVMVAVKGLDADFESNIGRLLTQNYPDYDLVFALASEDDEAYPHLASIAGPEPVPQQGTGLRRVKVVIAAHASCRGEKVNNLLAALDELPRRTPVLAFADADARMKTDWLRFLVAPLADPAVMVSTGFRWYLPGRSLASRLRAAWDTSIATMFREHGQNFAWGGSMAVRSADFERMRVADDYWSGSVSDDYGLTRAVRDSGGWIRFEPRCLVASAGEIGLWDFWRWSNRQIIITRVYASHYWRRGLASYTLFCGTVLLAVAAVLKPGPLVARGLAAGTLAAILILGLWKAWLRELAARLMFPEEASLLECLGSCYWRWWPVVPWWMLMNFVTAGFTDRIEWRGVKYRLVSPNEARVIREGS